MPWTEESVMSLRKEFILGACQEKANVSQLCRRYGISRPTGYKWLHRYQEDGEAGLKDLSRRPHHSPNRTGHEMEQAIVQLRLQYPMRGAHVLRRMLQNRDYQKVPGKSTVAAILKRHNLIGTDEALKHKAYVRFEHKQPNELWQMDFKGHIATNRGRCHPLTLLDDHSRFALGLRACSNEGAETVKDHLSAIFRRYGMPRRILVDNGPPWGHDLDHVLTPMTVWLMLLGTGVSHSRPYHPQTQGKIERFHRTLKAELLQGSTFADLQDCQKAFDQWRDHYNLERPHRALDLNTPASRYQVSPREFPEILPPIEYDPDDQVRKVDISGRISFQGRPFRVGKAFHHRPVALRPDSQDGVWNVFFSIHHIGSLDLTKTTSDTTNV